MTSEDSIERKRRLIGKIIDMFFEPDVKYTDELRNQVYLWLLDETDVDLKDEALMRKFEEIMDMNMYELETPKVPVTSDHL